MRSMLWAAVFGWVGLVAAAQDGKSPHEEALRRIAADVPKHLKAADADGSGTLSLAEFRVFEPALQKAAEAILNQLDPSIAQKKGARTLQKYDANGDGTLDEAEKKAMEEALLKKSIKDFDWDGDGRLDEREKQAQQWAAEGRQAGDFRKADKNDDGQLTADEISARLSKLTGIKAKKTD